MFLGGVHRSARRFSLFATGAAFLLSSHPNLTMHSMLSGGGRRLAMSNQLRAASIEILSFLLAEAIGVPALLHAHSSSEFVLVFTLGIACGGLGSRFVSDVARTGERAAAKTQRVPGM